MFLRKETRLFESQLGAKGFIYPKESFIVLEKNVEAEEVNLFCPIQKNLKAVLVKTDDDTPKKLFWVENKKY
jgi:hypothetical protein